MKSLTISGAKVTPKAHQFVSLGLPSLRLLYIENEVGGFCLFGAVRTYPLHTLFDTQSILCRRVIQASNHVIFPFS